jgi:uncharacterized damage-inducible protein DinB
MFTSIDQFEKHWEAESQRSQRVMDTLTDASLGQKVADDHRTLGRVAWHITTTIPEMANRTGLDVTGVRVDSPVPKTAAEIRSAYAAVSKSLLDEIKKKWQDTTLGVEDDMYGEKWKRGSTLHILIIHEVHHRGQMTVLMRQAGLRVPSLYGPAREDWAGYGAPVTEV